jgi:hypothetical protein
MNENEEMVTIEEQAPEPQKEPTKLDRFIQELSKYPDKETAKTHIQEIADKLQCAKSLGYKALKKITFQGQPSTEHEAKEATARIEQQEPEPITQEQQEEQGEETTPAEEIGQPAAPPQVPITAKAITTSIELAFKKAAKLLDYPDLALTHEEAQSLTDCWTPVLEHYAPQLSNNPMMWAALGTAIILAPRIIGLIVEKLGKRKEERKIIDVKPINPPTQSPPPQEMPPVVPPTMPQAADDKTPLEPTLTESVATTEKPDGKNLLKKL